MSFSKSLACVAVLAAGTMASAATISYNTSVGSTQAGQGGSFQLSQFDPSLGTLWGVKLDITGYSTGGSNILDNESGVSGTATVTIGSNITVTGPASLVVITQPNQSNTAPIAADDDGSADFTGADSVAVVGTNVSDSDSDSLFFLPPGLLDDLSAYQGLSTVLFNFTSQSNIATSANVGTTNIQTVAPNFNFDAVVTYYYDPIPEPASLALFGLGALLMLRRRKA